MARKVNTYGLKMIGIRRAAGATKGLRGYYCGQYVQISYDRDTGDVLADYHCSLGQNNWTHYHDPAIVTICNFSVRASMQDIADAIKERMDLLDICGQG